jgi:calcium/calmodulin-dependent protein kinase I
MPAAATPPTESTQIPVLQLPTRPVSASRLDTDLVRDSKLDTSFTGEDVVCHTSYTFHPRNRNNRIVVEEKWKVERYLGRGGFGQVDLQKCVQGPKESELRAVKKIIKDPYDDETKKINYDRELEAIAKFSHDKASDIQFLFWHLETDWLCSLQYVHCFARSFGWYENENAIFITMEYFENGDLQKHMRGRFPEFEVGQIASQILEGLSYMHDNGFAHRDLKPAVSLLTQKPIN